MSNKKNPKLKFILFLSAQIGEVHEYYTEMVALVVTSIVLQVGPTLICIPTATM